MKPELMSFDYAQDISSWLPLVRQANISCLAELTPTPIDI